MKMSSLPSGRRGSRRKRSTRFSLIIPSACSELEFLGHVLSSKNRLPPGGLFFGGLRQGLSVRLLSGRLDFVWETIHRGGPRVGRTSLSEKTDVERRFIG
ncbi:protein of unknown function [Kyrpidia spormannii]|uniref:Uncharacterized protein n=1 Tax=Kyrpidia spormannii TaxID=2055160 RepID=A0A6F9E4J9_9BACL|nr:protein of unknown function [Kyrpidia spormannii]